MKYSTANLMMMLWTLVSMPSAECWPQPHQQATATPSALTTLEVPTDPPTTTTVASPAAAPLGNPTAQPTTTVAPSKHISTPSPTDAPISISSPLHTPTTTTDTAPTSTTTPSGNPTVPPTTTTTATSTATPTTVATTVVTVVPSVRPTMLRSRAPTTSKPTEADRGDYVTRYFVDAGSNAESHHTFFQAPEDLTYRMPLELLQQHHTIAGTHGLPQTYFQTHRYAEMTYIFPALKPYSRVDVTLGFAEIYQPNCDIGVGARVMDIQVNGVEFVSNLDVLEHVPCYTAHFITKNRIKVDKNGEIAIVFSASANEPFVSTIFIERS